MIIIIITSENGKRHKLAIILIRCWIYHGAHRKWSHDLQITETEVHVRNQHRHLIVSTRIHIGESVLVDWHLVEQAHYIKIRNSNSGIDARIYSLLVLYIQRHDIQRGFSNLPKMSSFDSWMLGIINDLSPWQQRWILCDNVDVCFIHNVPWGCGTYPLACSSEVKQRPWRTNF